jgi:hypothetical protein
MEINDTKNEEMTLPVQKQNPVLIEHHLPRFLPANMSSHLM